MKPADHAPRKLYGTDSLKRRSLNYARPSTHLDVLPHRSGRAPHISGAMPHRLKLIKAILTLRCAFGVQNNYVINPACSAHPPSAVRITTSQAGVFQNTSSVNAARARPKSAADRIALVHTGL